MSEESVQFLEEVRGLEEEEERLHEKTKRNFITCNVCIVVFSFIACLSIYFIAIDYNKENFIPILMACLVFLAMSIYYATYYGRKYYRQRDVEIARRGRARVRLPLCPQNEEFEEESDSRSSPAVSTDPAADGPSNLPQTESSTFSEQTTTHESSEKTSLSDSTRGTFTTTATIECDAVALGDVFSAAKENIPIKDEDKSSKPSTSFQPDSTDCLTTDADSEDETGKIRHRRPTPD